QIWRYNPSIDVVFVYTYRVGHENDYKSAKTPRSVSAQEQIAEFYGIPSFDFNIPVVQLAEKEQLTYQSEKPEDGKIHFSTDGVHPLDAGHQIYTEVVCDAFRKMRAQAKTTPFPAPSTRTAKLAKSFIDGNFENAKSVPIKESQLSGDWKPLPANSPLSWTKSRLGDVVFTSDAPGAKLTFRFKGSQVKIYDILGPNGGQVRVTVDGKPHNNPIPRFDSFCTYWRLATLTLADGLDPTVVHEATVEIDAEQPSRQPVAFRLADPEKELAEPKYNGRNVWFGPILVLGDVVE
ncbi:MAG: SGNH/GDSL hydrolase family protein, partial [Thermoguttaceae bacterium]|nr:SGNH/GDSL hydrolase family protein [Thermoguttaceae bacterium]